MKTVLGIFATTLALYVWGVLYWGVSPIPYESLQKTKDDAKVQQVLAEYFPETGTYLIPGRGYDEATTQALFEHGPTAMVHIRLGPGKPVDPVVLIGGFVLNLVFVALLALFFNVAKAREFRDFARLSLVVGACAVVLIDGGDMIWWRETVSWKVWAVIYDFTAFLIAGHLLGIFMKERQTAP